jgi:Bacterial Ig domain/CARDB
MSRPSDAWHQRECSLATGSTATENYTRRIFTGFVLGTSALAFVPIRALAAQRRADLTISALSWSDDFGATWHNDHVLAESEVWFKAIVRNVGRVAIPPRVVIRIPFRVDGVVVAWSDTYSAGLAQGASVALRANGGPDGDKFWNAVDAGTYVIEARVDEPNRIVESNETNNRRRATLQVDPLPGEEPPIATADQADTPVNTPVNIPVVKNDSDSLGRNLVVSSVQSPSDRGGMVIIAADRKSVTYTPPHGFLGQDSFTYEVSSI